MKADYKVMIGEHDINEFMRCLDLGIGGGYVPHLVTISWKEHESVTKDRAESLCKAISNAIEASGKFEVMTVELLKIYEDY